MEGDNIDSNNKQESQEFDEKFLGIFINPRTDFGFKKVFYDEARMVSLSNSVIHARKKKDYIKTASFQPVEYLGDTEEASRSIVDAHCKTNKGEDIIIEMQNAKPMNFADRLIFYSTYPIREQAPKRRRKGQITHQEKKPWHYNLKALYIIAIVNFPMLMDEKEKNLVIDRIKLMSIKTNKVFSDKLNFIIMDLTKFNKKQEELKTQLDFWLYTLKYAETLKERPAEINDKLFIDLYDNILRTNKLTPEEMKAYHESVLALKDFSLFTDCAKIEGKTEGIEIGRTEGIEIGRTEGIKIGEKRGVEFAYTTIILNAAANGIPVEAIASFTNLTVEQVCNILKSKKDK
ncbi:MAG: Rpn family recombination-promoting nuclease/putative transposase [Prevotellaceae bacterium]|jgi:predicted transposase/invertase (TIGR01784 family)|nr:Rpn family recombination-promoting nuclease/putative transposase [Prevotellaceae bacterium]